jgi:hypothetical protein
VREKCGASRSAAELAPNTDNSARFTRSRLRTGKQSAARKESEETIVVFFGFFMNRQKLPRRDLPRALH